MSKNILNHIRIAIICVSYNDFGMIRVRLINETAAINNQPIDTDDMTIMCDITLNYDYTQTSLDHKVLKRSNLLQIY